MEDCIFCKIVKGKVPATVVHEDDNSIAFLDIQPTAKGHVLVIPKTHIVTMTDASNHDISEIFALVKNLMTRMKSNLPCDYVQISVVGEQVPHFHIHLIPRYHNDNFPSWPTTKYESADEMTSYANKIK